MTDLSLYISDGALKEAVIEQMVAAKLAEIHVADTPQALLKQTDGIKNGVILIDDSGEDKKITALVQNLVIRNERPTLLVLGESKETEGVTESFHKPLRLGHLMTRLRYYLETAPLLRDPDVVFGSYRLEPKNRRVLCLHSEAIRLTEKETALLVYLASSSQPVTRRDILASVWGYDERIDTHTLETHIYQLRRKLSQDNKEGSENWLINEAGTYRLARD